jgi:hypothetical protein
MIYTYMISYSLYDIIEYIIYDIIHILQTPNPHGVSCSFLAAPANLAWAQRSDAGDGGNDSDREMDQDEARDYTSDYYICPVANVLGRAPVHSVLHQLQQSTHDSKQLQGRLASWKRLRRHAAGPGQRSRLCKVNIWMWRYDRGRSRMVAITEAEWIRREHISESRTRAAETGKRHSKTAAAAGAAETPREWLQSSLKYWS